MNLTLLTGDSTALAILDDSNLTLWGLIALPVLMAIIIGMIFYLKRTRYRY